MTAAGIFITETPPHGSGIRTSVKDLFDTAGVRTTYGSAVFADHVPEATAPAVARLEAAGYATVGKTNLHEFAWGITSENPHYGTVPNPRAPGRVAGGSSGGNAAALAAGLVDAALGTDSAGSIRIPSACCGTTGFKPTFGLVALEGCFPLAPTFDCAGPMAADVAGCERMLAALASGFEPAALHSLADVRAGVAWTDRAEPLVRERVEAAAARFPHGRPVEVPAPDGVYPCLGREAAEVHAELFREHREAYGENVATKIEWALTIEDAEVEAARAARDRYRERIAALFAEIDVLVTPTIPMVAPPTGIGDLALRGRMIELTLPWNVVGAPALALPCGRAEDGLPASVQLVGRPGADATVLAAGRLLERAVAGSVQRRNSRPAARSTGIGRCGGGPP
ncbi:MAG TPA: amidase [Solirubrobacteraceae bacterium]|nr:amidase [Solirubrobacteraceae bacterium]